MVMKQKIFSRCSCFVGTLRYGFVFTCGLGVSLSLLNRDLF